jgi:DtxR family transcriptional regulator, Mn-dependent transcriptional regulator
MNPVNALLIFFAILTLSVFVFRPVKGWYWKMQDYFRKDEKTLLEDLLKQLYHLEYENETASIHAMQGLVKVKKERLVKLLSLLQSKQLIMMDGQKINLTGQGRDYALKIIRAHRLWEKYLASETGIQKSEWHDLAERAEHKLSAAELADLDTKLGNPRFDPHGDPIPTIDGYMPKLFGQPMTKFKVGQKGYIVHIEDEPQEVYQKILDKELHIGAHFQIMESNDKMIRFKSEGEEITLPPIVAANIRVKELNKGTSESDHVFRLNQLKKGETAKVLRISNECRGAQRRRLLDLGVVPGSTVRLRLSSPLEDPKAYEVKGSLIALRKEQAAMILIKKEKQADATLT